MTQVTIRLESMRFFSRHGLYAFEQKNGAEFEVNVELCVKVGTTALQGDELEGTLDYSRVYELIASEMETPCKLLEHFVWKVREKLKAFPEIISGTISLSKLEPPIGGKCRAVTVELPFDFSR